MAHAWGAELILLHVLPAPLYATLDLTGALFISLRDTERAAALGRLRRLATGLAPRPRGLHALVLGGGPLYQKIIGVARRLRCDLILLPIHDHAGWRRALLGCTAAAVVRHAECPVLVVPTTACQCDIGLRRAA